MRNNTQYLNTVRNFINLHGPDFTVKLVVTGGAPVDCQCCGYRGLTNQWFIANSAGQEWVVGCECVDMIVPVRADLPAAAVRNLNWNQMEVMATLIGLAVDNSWSPQEFAGWLIHHRRCQANKRGHQSRVAAYGGHRKPAAQVA